MAEKQRAVNFVYPLAAVMTVLAAGLAFQAVAFSAENNKLTDQVSTLTSKVATLERENTDLESDLSDSQQRGDACLRQSQAYGEAAYNYGSFIVWLLGDTPVGPTPDMSLGTDAMARGNDVIGCY